MRIVSKHTPRRKVAKKSPEKSRKSFNDIIVIGDREEKADLIDIEEIPGTRGAGHSVLDAKGQFLYEIDFLIDAEDAISESVTAVEIQFFRESPAKRKKTKGRSQKDIRERFKSKKKRRTKRKESDASVSKPKRVKPIARAFVSLGEEFIEAAQLKTQLERINSSLENVKDLVPKEEVSILTATPKEDSQKRSIRIEPTARLLRSDDHLYKTRTVSGTPTFTPVPASTPTTSKKSALRAVQKSGLSPMSIGKSLHPISPHFISSSRDSSALGTPKKKRTHRKVRKTSFKPVKRVKSPLTSKKSNRKIIEDNKAREAQRAFMERLERKKEKIEEELGEIKFETRMIPYSVDIGIRLRNAGDKQFLYMGVRLIHDKNTRGRGRLYRINHKEQLDEMLTPDEPPEISAGIIGNKPNEVRLMVTQNDEIATSVNILRRKITEDEGDEESKFQEIASIPVHSETGAAAYIDTGVTNVHPVSYEYRAVPVGPTGSDAPEHTASVVVKGVKPIGAASSKHADPDANIALSAINKYDRVGVTIESIPDDVVAIRVFKEDLVSDSFFSKSERRFSPVIPPDAKTGIIEVGKGVTSVYVEDIDVVPDRTYRYKCVLRRLRQPEIEGNDEEVIHYIKPRVRTPIEAYIENVKATRSGDRPEVEFDLVAEFSDPGLELLGDIFSASGVSGNFIEDIRKNRDQLKDVAAFLVSRVDLYTGRSVQLGVFAPGTFKDSVTLQKRVRSFMIPGRKYRYIAKLSLRPPEAFFKNALTNIDVQNKGLLDLSETDRYEVLAQRFLSGFGATSGLASDSELNNMSEMGLMGQFEIGKTGIELEETVTTLKKRAKFVNASVRPRKRDNLIVWTVEGDPFDVNMYIVVLNYKGSRGVIGTIPATSSTINYFRDKMYYRELGKLSYTVYPVYNSMRIGKPIETNTISRNRDVSDELLKRMMSRKADQSRAET